LLGLLVLSASVQAGVLDFDYTTTPLAASDSDGNGPVQPPGNGGWISQAYGDVAGLVDVSYRYIDPANQVASSLQTWPGGYDELVYVAWTGLQSGGDRGQVHLAAVGAGPVTLTGFSLGSWSGAEGRPETVTVHEIGNATPLFSYTGLIGVGDVSNTFTIGMQSPTGFVIEWTSPWWTAIDNIDSSASPVPEPGSWALLAGGLAATAVLHRRRRSSC
jgi:hypothetical protein